MNSFLKHAEEIFASAQRGDGEDCELAILIAGDGLISMVQAAGWELEPLRIHHGAREAYRVKRSAGRVRLEAHSPGQSCVLESQRPERALAEALADFPRYVTA